MGPRAKCAETPVNSEFHGDLRNMFGLKSVMKQEPLDDQDAQRDQPLEPEVRKVPQPEPQVRTVAKKPPTGGRKKTKAPTTKPLAATTVAQSESGTRTVSLAVAEDDQPATATGRRFSADALRTPPQNADTGDVPTRSTEDAPAASSSSTGDGGTQEQPQPVDTPLVQGVETFDPAALPAQGVETVDPAALPAQGVATIIPAPAGKKNAACVLQTVCISSLLKSEPLSLEPGNKVTYRITCARLATRPLAAR